MAMRLSDYRFVLLLTTFAIALLVACSGDVSSGGADGATQGTNPVNDSASEPAPASMTRG
jgi:hypothetical protein